MSGLFNILFSVGGLLGIFTAVLAVLAFIAVRDPKSTSRRLFEFFSRVIYWPFYKPDQWLQKKLNVFQEQEQKSKAVSKGATIAEFEDPFWKPTFKLTRKDFTQRGKACSGSMT
jgi:hypothetical protein